jgi:hypothetical protein
MSSTKLKPACFIPLNFINPPEIAHDGGALTKGFGQALKNFSDGGT